ncbi:hypothetical protein B7494_g7897 [Chlorociboria aeruginascens]|nr:hypothetical protein B7494_g7897 [Chlorociboria aeruginascens]
MAASRVQVPKCRLVGNSFSGGVNEWGGRTYKEKPYGEEALMLWELRAYGPKGTWAVVTGASDGLGKEYALQLAAKGFNIVLVSRTESKLQALADEIDHKYASSIKTKILPMDFARNDDADYAKLKALIDGLDVGILINNVGQSHSIPVPFLLTPKEEMKNIITINCIGTLKITQIIAPGMVQRKRGLILTMGSFGGLGPTPLLATYSGSKAFLQQWSTALAGELKGTGVDVQLTLSYLVTSAMSKVRKTSLLIPNARTFVKSALAKVGRSGGAQQMAYTSTPFWSHALVQWWLENTLGLGSETVVGQSRVMHETALGPRQPQFPFSSTSSPKMTFPTTPQRPLPGAYFHTPAVSRFNIRTPAPPQPNFRSFGEPRERGLPEDPRDQNLAPAQQPQGAPQQRNLNQLQALPPIRRAARTINEFLQRDASYPDLDSYVRQGIDSVYDLPSPATEAAWAPFQRTKMYEIPDEVIHECNRAEVSTMMGIFADLNHAWVAVDNSLYLWDYSHPNPELLGYEDQPNSITAVKLIIPRPGVFINSITHILVVATTAEIILLGVEAVAGPNGVISVTLYQTQMVKALRGVTCTVIEGSSATGRIFYGGVGSNGLWELAYKQEDTFFFGKCYKICHTSPAYTNIIPTVPHLWGSKDVEYVEDIVVDDSRGLVYTLSSESSIRTFYIDSPTTLKFAIEKKRNELLRDISHMVEPNNPLFTSNMRITSISPISGKEGTRLHLMATTTSGCRLFLSATRSYGYSGQGAPQSMQIHHIKFPPRVPQQLPGPAFRGAEPPVETTSLALSHTRLALRYPPGFFFCFVAKEARPGHDALFLSASDTGQISAQARDLAAQSRTYYEQAFWLELKSRAEAVGLVTKPFGAAETPVGFGNELAVQFDQPPTEIAILTNTGIHIIRRRRLVDIFASALRHHRGTEGLETEIRRFIQKYGRGETAATALAVACGQGSDVNPGEIRMGKIADPETIEAARRAFVDHGGRPSINENLAVEGQVQAAELIIPSSRHEGLALYMSRLVRSLWKSPVVRQGVAPTGAISISTTIPVLKLATVQDDLTKLRTFLEANKTFIEGLAGPEGLQRAVSQQEEVALQGEHQALYSLQSLNTSMIEGISFVQMLFEERVDQIWTALDDNVKQQLRDLTYELLFASDDGKNLARVLVRAIVNRNIADGSNVDTVADALRRRCGSFCTPDDVIIFKAQEQLQMASDASTSPDVSRNLLNESLRLFKQVAQALSLENLRNACHQFTDLQFYAGAITLALLVAKESDRGNRALSWVNDERPDNDPRQAAYEFRRDCYDLIHEIIRTVDDFANGQPDTIDGRPSLVATRRAEAHTVINESDDELFQYDLFDWYLAQGWVDKLLAVDSPAVIRYLQAVATMNVYRADLLWRYYVHHDDFYSAASVQLDLVKSDFDIPLAKRIEYLSRAHANALAANGGIGRQARQVLLHEISELLEVANIQDELLRRLQDDDRFNDEQKAEIGRKLDGQIQGLTELYNEYADQASYFDLCLMIYEAANHRNEADINATWQSILEYTHQQCVNEHNRERQPYEAVISMVRSMAQRLNMSETTFPPSTLIPLIERYSLEQQNNVGPRTWAIDLFIHIQFPYETILSTLNSMWLNDIAPFVGRHKNILGEHIIYTAKQWYDDCIRNNTRIFGGEQNAAQIDEILAMVMPALDMERREEGNELRKRIQRSFL